MDIVGSSKCARLRVANVAWRASTIPDIMDVGSLHELEANKPPCLLVECQRARAPGPCS